MKTVKIAIFSAAFLSPAATLAAYAPLRVVEDKERSATSLAQEVEGYPNSTAHQSCVLVSRETNDAQGRFIGYQTFPVCR